MRRMAGGKSGIEIRGETGCAAWLRGQGWKMIRETGLNNEQKRKEGKFRRLSFVRSRRLFIFALRFFFAETYSRTRSNCFGEACKKTLNKKCRRSSFLSFPFLCSPNGTIHLRQSSEIFHWATHRSFFPSPCLVSRLSCETYLFYLSFCFRV